MVSQPFLCGGVISQKSQNPKYQFSAERLSTASEGFRLWVGQAWKIGVLMAKGAYLLGERQRLLNRLGEEAFQRIKSGEWKGDSLEALVKQLERTTKKIEIEEKLIQNARFGVRAQAPEKAEPMESEASDEVSQPKPETKKEKGKPT